MAAGDTPKQRLTDLATGEVSIVDDPANEREWNIVKRKGANMTTAMVTKAKFAEMKKNLQKAEADMQEASEVATKAQEDKKPDAPAFMQKAIEAMTKYRDLLKAMPPEPKADAAEPDADDEGKKTPTQKNDADQQPGQTGSEPAARPPIVETDLSKVASETANAIKAAIVKSLGGTTNVDGLAAAAKATLSALNEANAEVAKSVVVAVMKELPGKTSVSIPSQVRPVGEGGVDEGEKGEMFVKMKKSLETLQEEVAQITKARNASTSAGGGDNNDGKKPVKKNTSMWSGVLGF